jgi:hypothetical protein
MPFFRPAILVAALLAPASWAQAPASVTTESRDAASSFIGTANFIVGRVGRECLAMVGRTESAQQFVSTWQQRNAPYVTASAKYMDKRLDEVAASGGAEKRDAFLRQLRDVVQGNGDSVVRSWLQSGSKVDGCMRAVTLVDTGALDISPKIPMYREIEALVRWAEQ